MCGKSDVYGYMSFFRNRIIPDVQCSNLIGTIECFNTVIEFLEGLNALNGHGRKSKRLNDLIEPTRDIAASRPKKT